MASKPGKQAIEITRELEPHLAFAFDFSFQLLVLQASRVKWFEIFGFHIFLISGSAYFESHDDLESLLCVV